MPWQTSCPGSLLKTSVADCARLVVKCDVYARGSCVCNERWGLWLGPGSRLTMAEGMVVQVDDVVVEVSA